MKNLKFTLLVFIFILLTVPSCTDKVGRVANESEQNIMNDGKGDNTAKGDDSDSKKVIAKLNSEREFEVIIDKQMLIAAFEAASVDNNYDYSNVEIVQSVLDNEKDIEYLLLATNFDMTIKTAVQLYHNPAEETLTLDMAMPLIITCNSDCQTGCTPTRMRNPNTNQIELICLKCDDGGKCLKSVTASM